MWWCFLWDGKATVFSTLCCCCWEEKEPESSMCMHSNWCWMTIPLLPANEPSIIIIVNNLCEMPYEFALWIYTFPSCTFGCWLLCNASHSQRWCFPPKNLFTLFYLTSELELLPVPVPSPASVPATSTNLFSIWSACIFGITFILYGKNTHDKIYFHK